MDLNLADYISRFPFKHTAEERRVATTKAARVIAEEYVHPATKRRAEVIHDKLSRFAAILPPENGR